MPVEFRIEMTPEAQVLLAQMQTFPRRMQVGLVRALNTQNELTASTAIAKRLSFNRDQPPTLEGLRVQSSKLRRSIRRGGEGNISEAARVEGDSIVSAIGTNVQYAAIHEFGWTGTVGPHLRRRFKSTTLRGAFAPLGRGLRGLTGITRRKSVRVQARGGDVFVGQSKVKTYPARSFIGRTLHEREPQYSAALSAVIVKTWDERGGQS